MENKVVGIIGGDSLSTKISKIIMNPETTKPFGGTAEEEAATQPKAEKVPQAYTSIRQIPAGVNFRMRGSTYGKQENGSIRRLDKPMSKKRAKMLKGEAARLGIPNADERIREMREAQKIFKRGGHIRASSAKPQMEE